MFSGGAPIMKVSAILIATIALGAVAAPAIAAKADGEKAKVTYDAKRDRYCISQKVTGAYLPVKDCRSKEDWAKAGLVVDQKNDVEIANR
jgi:hypothetical protein